MSSAVVFWAGHFPQKLLVCDARKCFNLSITHENQSCLGNLISVVILLKYINPVQILSKHHTTR